MGAGASFRSDSQTDVRSAIIIAPSLEVEQSIGVNVIVKERKLQSDFKHGRQLSLPILKLKSPEGLRARRPLKAQQSIKSMSLRHRSRRENSYRIQKELASSLVNLHKQNFSGDLMAPTLQGSHERIDSILTSLDAVKSHYFSSTRDVIPEVDSFPLSTDSILKLQTPRPEGNIITVQPTQRKNAFGLHSKRPPALKLCIQDDSDWIQVEDDDGGDFGMSPRQRNPIPLAGKNGKNEKNEQSYMFTQSGTIFVDGFLEGIGKEGIVRSGRPSSSTPTKRSLKLPMRDRLVLLCKLGHGASGVVYKALDLVDMRLVALKMISVFEHGKRRQMVRELSALFQVLRQKKFDLKKVQKGGKLKGVRSQFSLRSMSEELNMKNKMKAKVKEGSLRLTKVLEISNNISNGNNNNVNNDINNTNISINSSRHKDYHSLETVKEIDSEKTLSQSIDSSCFSTPSSSYDTASRRLHPKGLNPCLSHNASSNSNNDNNSDNYDCRKSTSDDNDNDDDDVDEYGISILIEKDKNKQKNKNGEDDDNDQEDEDLDEFKDSCDDDKTDIRINSIKNDDKNDETEHSGLEKFFVKPASEFIVDFFDAFSNIDDGGVALMMEYMDGGSLQDIVDDGGCDDEITLANIAVQALIGLAFLHSCGQLHRDLKPGNFLISHTGDVKVADLGILCQLDERRAPVDRDNDGDSDSGINININNNINKNNSNVVHPNKNITHSNSAIRKNEIHRPETSARNQNQNSIHSHNHNDRGIETAQMSDDDSPSPLTPCFSSESPMPHTKTFVGTVTFMSPERIDGREYSYPSDVWAFGLSLMTLAKGSLPIDTQGGYWTILHCIRDEEPPSLPNNGKFSDEFKDFLSSCLQKDPKKRLTCNQLLLHSFLRKAVPEECGIGSHNNGSGRTDDVVTREEENLREAKETETRGLFELHSILSALHLHFERIQLGISPKSGLQHDELSSKHPFFYGLKTKKVEDFLQLFLLGDNYNNNSNNNNNNNNCSNDNSNNSSNNSNSSNNDNSNNDINNNNANNNNNNSSKNSSGKYNNNNHQIIIDKNIIAELESEEDCEIENGDKEKRSKNSNVIKDGVNFNENDNKNKNNDTNDQSERDEIKKNISKEKKVLRPSSSSLLSSSCINDSIKSSTRICNIMSDLSDGNKRLITLAKQLHLSIDRIKIEIILFFENLDKDKDNDKIGNKKGSKFPRRFSRAITPKASHSRKECK